MEHEVGVRGVLVRAPCPSEVGRFQDAGPQRAARSLLRRERRGAHVPIAIGRGAVGELDGVQHPVAVEPVIPAVRLEARVAAIADEGTGEVVGQLSLDHGNVGGDLCMDRGVVAVEVRASQTLVEHVGHAPSLAPDRLADMSAGAGDPGERQTLQIEKVVAGGRGLGRAPDGRIALVSGALPGERVEAIVRVSRRDVLFADLASVEIASPDRVAPPCPKVAIGCGGCDWQHIAPAAQAVLKRAIVIDAFARIGRISDAPLSDSVTLPARAYRQRARVFVGDDGRPAYRQSRSHTMVPFAECLVLHPTLDALLREAPLPRRRELEIAVGERTGEVLASPRVGPPARSDHYHEEVAGSRFRISAGSFFQIRTDGAEALVDLVRAAAGSPASLVDLYGGVGVFAATIPAARAIVVESGARAVSDARHNLRGRSGAFVVRNRVERWQPTEHAEVVIADPSRSGLGRPGVATVLACRPERVVLVSCDAAAMARDVRAIIDAGYELERSTVVDLFPMTAHIETVSDLRRVRPRAS